MAFTGEWSAGDQRGDSASAEKASQRAAETGPIKDQIEQILLLDLEAPRKAAAHGASDLDAPESRTS